MTAMEEVTNKTIVNLDDDPDFNRVLKVILKKEGYQLFSATQPEEFAKLVKTVDPALCMIDINLDVGQGAGFTFLQAMRNKLDLKLPIFIVSRRSSREDIARALELGANDFIPKPIDDVYLIQKLNIYFKRPDLEPLPYFKVSEKDWPCEFSYNLEISEISEFGFTLASKHFLTKGTYIELSGDFIKEVTLLNSPLKATVNSSWINEDTGLYNSFVELDAQNENLIANVRNYILKNTPSY